MILSAPLLQLLLAANGVSGAELGTASAVSKWNIKESPHFEVLHESAWSPNSIVLELEKMFSAMRLNMAMFAPWMAAEKSKIYIYGSRSSYLAGEFAPPKWSKGLAYPDRKIVVVYDTGDIVKLKAVLAHELSHLYFEGYFAEKFKYPPQWLNEGLAVYLEDIVFTEGGLWRRALPYFNAERRLPFDDFFGIKLESLKTDARISDWYLQSFGVVSYLYRPHTRLQFKNFCEALRGGDAVETALWKNYRISGGKDFSLKWETWLAGYARPAGSQGQASSAFVFKPVTMSSFPFTDFGAKK